jgi:translation initiation factor 3 subunit K
VNFGLLRLYAMFPARSDVEMLVLLLAKALTALPEPDFLQAVYLLAPQHAADARVQALVELDSALQRADFARFWALAAQAPLREVLARVPDFDATLRSFIALALSRTYQTIALADLAAALNLADAAPFVAQRGWAVEAGSRVRLPPTAETTPRPARAAVEELGLRPHDVSALLFTLGKGR